MNEQTNYPPLPWYPLGRRERTLTLAVLLLAVLTADAICYGGLNLGFSLGALALMGCEVWYLYRTGGRFDGYSGGLMALAAGIAAGFARSADGPGKGCMLLLLLFAVNLSLCLASGQNLRDRGRLSSVLDAFRAAFTLGFGSMGRSARGLNHARRQGNFGKNGGAVLLGLLAAIPVAAALLALLMRADAAFQGLMNQLPQLDWSEPIYALVLGSLGAWVLLSRSLGLRMAEKPPRTEHGARGLPAVTVIIILGTAGAIYCVYFLSQLAYFTSALAGILPEGFTLSQYARRGFFEMAALGTVNLGLMGLGLKIQGKNRPGKLLAQFLGVVTLILIATASAKMLLYIRGYGLTRLRLVTEIFMIWLAAAAIFVSIRIWKPGFGYMQGLVLAALILAAATFWADVDTQVARYNVRAYQSGRLEQIDVNYFWELGDGAAPYLAQLCQDSDPDVSQCARRILSCRAQHAGGLRSWNYAAARADALQEVFGESPPPERAYAPTPQAEVFPSSPAA